MPYTILLVQSPTYSPLEIRQRIDEFIADFGQSLRDIDPEQWQATKEAVIARSS